MEKGTKSEQNSIAVNNKRVWTTPEIVDLNIGEATQNVAVKTASAPDGGPSFADYNS